MSDERRTEPGAAKTYTVEVGPLTVYGFGKRDIARMERKILAALDTAAREFVAVGPRSKVVRSSAREVAA